LVLEESTLAEFEVQFCAIAGKFYFYDNQIQDNLLFQANETVKSMEFEGGAIKNLKYGSHIGERVAFHGVKAIEGGCWNFNKQDCSRLQFLSCDLSHAEFLGADLRDTRFDSCHWDQSGPYAQVYGHQKILEDNKPEELENLRSLYLRLKKNHDKDDEYALSGDFHYQEMNLRRRLLSGKTGVKHQAEKAILGLYKVVSDYGESPVRLVLSLFASFGATALGLGVLKKLSRWEQVTQLSRTDLSQLMNHSFAEWPKNLELVLYGLAPSVLNKSVAEAAGKLNSPAKFLLLTEAIVGVTLITLLIMAIRRRFKR